MKAEVEESRKDRQEAQRENGGGTFLSPAMIFEKGDRNVPPPLILVPAEPDLFAIFARGN